MSRLLLIVVTVTTFAAGWLVNDAVTAPHCPTEDSCTIVYRDGAWHITEVTP